MFQFNTFNDYVNALVRLHQAISCRLRTFEGREIDSKKIIIMKATDLAMINLLSEISGVDSRLYFDKLGLMVDFHSINKYLSDIDSMISALKSL